MSRATARRPIDGDWPTLATVGLAGIAGLSASYLVAGPSQAFVGAAMGSIVVDLTPGGLVTVSITQLGDLGQLFAFATALGLVVTGYAILALVGITLGRRTELPHSDAFFAGVGGWWATIGLTGAMVPSIAPGVAIAGVLLIASPWPARPGVFAPRRRRILGVAAGTIAFGAVSFFAHRGEDGPGGATLDLEAGDRATIRHRLTTATAASLDVEGLDPLVSESFYEVDINSVNPRIDAREWSLRFTGRLDGQPSFSYEDVLAFDPVHRFITLRCVGESRNGRKMDNALWTGVPIARLLADRSIDSSCDCVMLRAADDYYEEFPLAALRRGMLAYGMNGTALPQRHGYPVRALIPGHWGEINVKWLTEIEFLDREAQGFWEKRGWHGTGPVTTVAKIHAVDHLPDGRVRVGGHAYAGTRGVSAVQVSTDGGSTWRSATLSAPLPGTDVWRQWAVDLSIGRPIEVIARAVEADGTIQPRRTSPAFPSGPTGWVSRTISP